MCCYTTFIFLPLIASVPVMGSLLCSLMLAAFLWRKLILLSPDIKRDLIGKPLLLPARLIHTRRFPETERYNYWYDYFLIGIPVGLRGRIGNLLSIDNLRGRDHEEKLHVFLKSVGEDPKEFPYAYLISELTAMIMEINNSFFEKRNFFFRSTTVTASTTGHHPAVSLHFSASLPRSKQYKGTWEKDIFDSPSEKVGGLMVSKSIDTVVGPSLESNLSSNNLDGQVKVTTRLSSWEKLVDPLKAPGWTMARFIAPLRIRLRGRLTYLKRPKVRPGSIPRKETDIKRALDLPFRQYLSDLASHTSFPVSIKYIPPKSIHFDDMTFYSLTCTASSSQSTLANQPLTPRFYTSFSQYDSPQAAFSMETRATPTNSDESSCRLFISDYSLMDQILATTGQTLDAEAAKSEATNFMDWGFKMLRIIVSSLRKSPAETFVDRFVGHHVHPSMQYRPSSNYATYQRGV
ncbi:hypothetical protein BDV36DRAFT_309249 [Aspergillus pseudocaelatus]|uniref:Cytochrome P450 n=1 Tax=Aspergillus pseudocaelatus TaxID=1825620 RepID=A0ABQ6X0U2_9EURO|nr:hypothetical protein BDV36DRAFT_309249 [Aspergillus pseudocaelatus]